eukprot:10785111-Alexandrium_andersonii.AAC.1
MHSSAHHARKRSVASRKDSEIKVVTVKSRLSHGLGGFLSDRVELQGIPEQHRSRIRQHALRETPTRVPVCAGCLAHRVSESTLAWQDIEINSMDLQSNRNGELISNYAFSSCANNNTA